MATVVTVVVNSDETRQSETIDSASGSGEIGRRTALRWLRSKGHGGSSPPFRTNPRSRPKNRYKKEELAAVVSRCFTWEEVCNEFNVPARNSSQGYLLKLAREWGIDASHFRGRGWASGVSSNRKKTIEDYLVLNGPKIKNTKMVEMLLETGMKDRACEGCGAVEWFGVPIILELDHVNRNIRDMRYENLQLLCPTCHAYKTLADRGCIKLPIEFACRFRSSDQGPSRQTSSDRHSSQSGEFPYLQGSEQHSVSSQCTPRPPLRSLAASA
jgi:hypothetical protein